MDSFVSLAKKGLEAYEQHQNGGGSSESNYGKTGGAEYNSPHHSDQGRSSSGRPNFDNDAVVRTAEQHGSGDSSLFQTAMSFMNSKSDEHERPINEAAAQEAHKQAYHEDNAGNLDASSIGSAAALQTLKKFTSGSSSSSGGGGSQSQLISMAMAEATKLFDKSGGASGGNKQDAVNSAAMTVMKLLVQSKFSGASTTGGSNSGGLSSLMSLASKFA